MRILVTGGGGFIGANLVRRLLDEGHDVSVIDNFATGKRENLASVAGHVRVFEVDIRSADRLRAAMRGCDVVSHQAALPSVPRSIVDPMTTHEVNATGTLNVLTAARDTQVERVVVASSSSVYGANRALPKRESLAAQPLSPYAVSKLAAEGYAFSFGRVYGLSTLSLRYFNVFGPGQDPLSEYAAVIPRFISAALRGEAPIVYGDGRQTRDFTYVDNVVDANVQAVTTSHLQTNVLNVACGTRISLNEVIAVLEALVDHPLMPEYRAPRPGDIKDSWADIGAAAEALDWTPVVPFAEGLRRTLENFPRDMAERLVSPG